MGQQSWKIKKKKKVNKNLTPEFCILHKDSPLESMTTIPPNIALDKNLSSGYWKDIFKQKAAKHSIVICSKKLIHL